MPDTLRDSFEESLLEGDDDSWKRILHGPSLEMIKEGADAEPPTPISQALTHRIVSMDENSSGEDSFEWTDMVHITGPRDASERLKSYW